MSIGVDLPERHLGDAVPITVTVYEPGTTDVTDDDISGWTFEFWAARGNLARAQSAAFTKTTGFTVDNTAKTVTFTVSSAQTDLLQVGANCFVLRRTNSGAEATLARGGWPMLPSRTPA